MSVEQARAVTKRALLRRGQMFTLERTNPSPQPKTTASVLALVRNFTPNELASGVMQGNRKAIVLAEDVEAAEFPQPLRANADALILGTSRFVIKSVDDQTRRVGGVLVAYELQVAG